MLTNYNDYELCNKTKNQCCLIYEKHSFNKSLDNSLNYLTQLEQLTFGYNFNQSLGNSIIYQTQLKKLTFGYSLNCPFFKLSIF